VRQLTDAAGTVILGQNYAPYGAVISSFGSGTSNYGYAGEWTDTTGLQHLRARYMDPGTGRFISRDTWAGDYNNPMSLNKWMYVEGNPVNYTDPLGYWRWWLTGSRYHFLIEQFYEGFPTNSSKQLEYPIPGTPFRHADMFNSVTGDIYEIEPWYKNYQALPQV